MVAMVAMVVAPIHRACLRWGGEGGYVHKQALRRCGVSVVVGGAMMMIMMATGTTVLVATSRAIATTVSRWALWVEMEGGRLATMTRTRMNSTLVTEAVAAATAAGTIPTGGERAATR